MPTVQILWVLWGVNSLLSAQIVATAASTAALLAKHDGDVLLFPTDRSTQVKMSDALPQVWADAGPSTELQERVARSCPHTPGMTVDSGPAGRARGTAVPSEICAQHIPSEKAQRQAERVTPAPLREVLF